MELKLNLGCGYYKREGFVNIDRAKECDPDMVIDLDPPFMPLRLPFGDDSVDLIYSHHVLEHIIRFKELNNECYRVLKVGGKFEVIVPQGANPHVAFADPDHKRHFVYETFKNLASDSFNMKLYGYKLWKEWKVGEDNDEIRAVLTK
jgi:predicted SAM-dependent methyltransferase